MKTLISRIRIVAVIVVICTMLAVLTATAWASGPEFGKCTPVATGSGTYKDSGCTKKGLLPEEKKYEWEPLTTPVKFTFAKEKETGPLFYSTAGGSELASTTFTGKGEFANAKEMRNVEFHGQGSCATVGITGIPGIVTKEVKEEKNIDGIAFNLPPESGSFIACSGGPPFLRGAAIIKTQTFGSSGTSGEWTNKMFNKEKLWFHGERFGRQVPDRFEGGPLQNPEGSFGSIFELNAFEVRVLLKTEPGTTKVELRQCGASC